MKLINILLILLCGICLTTQATAKLKCGKGQHARRVNDGKKVCAPCPPGTFISLETHSLRRCNYCTIPFNVLNERLLKNCTPFSDTQIGCHDGYTRVCYGDTGVVQFLGKWYGKCVLDPERNLTCSQGQRIQCNLDGVKTCLPCPRGTFNSGNNHTNKECVECKKPRRKKHEQIVRPCTSTSDTVIGCQQGFTRVMPRTQNGAGVCMVHRRHGLPIPCGRGHYVNQDHDGYEVCTPCPSGTFNSNDNYTEKNCTNCSRPELTTERILKNCTSSSDTVIGCVDGYYRNNGTRHEIRTKGSCEKCSICWHDRRYELEPCQPFQDTNCSKEPATEFICGKGQHVTYENQRQICAPCPSDTFNDEKAHTYPDCTNCTKADTSLPELEKCTSTSDTVIGCQAGYFRKPYFKDGEKSYGDCQKCSSCAHSNMYEIKPCGPKNDAACGFTVTCPKGHFLQTSKSGSKLGVCMPCPSGTFNSNDKHRNVECVPCSRLEQTMERILKNCTSSSDTEIGCVEGYYRKEERHYGIIKTYGSCEKCSICWQERRSQTEPCQPFRDTICSKQTAAVFICGKGQYVTYENKRQICAPCPPGTFSSKNTHTSTDCARCAQPNNFTHEVTLGDCTPTSDTVIACQPGYFRTSMKIHGECEKCSSCEYQNLQEITPCGPKSDTVCGPTPNLSFT